MSSGAAERVLTLIISSNYAFLLLLIAFPDKAISLS
jgi:hypothetical protein